MAGTASGLHYVNFQGFKTFAKAVKVKVNI